MLRLASECDRMDERKTHLEERGLPAVKKGGLTVPRSQAAIREGETRQEQREKGVVFLSLEGRGSAVGANEKGGGWRSNYNRRRRIKHL